MWRTAERTVEWFGKALWKEGRLSPHDEERFSAPAYALAAFVCHSGSVSTGCVGPLQWSYRTGGVPKRQKFGQAS